MDKKSVLAINNPLNLSNLDMSECDPVLALEITILTTEKRPMFFDDGHACLCRSYRGVSIEKVLIVCLSQNNQDILIKVTKAYLTIMQEGYLCFV